MNYFIATASCDWGGIFYDRRIEASSFGSAVAKAGRMAHKEARKSPKLLVLRVTKLGAKDILWLKKD